MITAIIQNHLTEIECGEHDDQCEWRANGHFVCHCHKRKREAEGFTEPPGELIHRYPLCPRCLEEVDGDADGFTCSTCCVSWGHNALDTGSFTDDYGDLDPSPFDARAVLREQGQ